MEFQRFALPDGVTVYTARLTDPAARHVQGRALCRAAVADFCGLDGQEVTVATAPGGKPYAVGVDAQFSLSHSGGLLLCAVGKAPVGADVERERTVSPRLLARARRAGYDGKTEFLLWWTAREANCKRLGRGFTWSALPPPAQLYQGTLEQGGERYFYSVYS